MKPFEIELDDSLCTVYKLTNGVLLETNEKETMFPYYLYDLSISHLEGRDNNLQGFWASKEELIQLHENLGKVIRGEVPNPADKNKLVEEVQRLSRNLSFETNQETLKILAAKLDALSHLI